MGLFIAQHSDRIKYPVQIAQLPQKLCAMFHTMIYHHFKSRDSRCWNQFWVPFHSSPPERFHLDGHRQQQQKTWTEKRDDGRKNVLFCVINSVYNLVCTFRSFEENPRKAETTKVKALYLHRSKERCLEFSVKSLSSIERQRKQNVGVCFRRF